GVLTIHLTNTKSLVDWVFIYNDCESLAYSGRFLRFSERVI
ncbi:hypothetical protein LINPERHAP1_LOCUS16199, partial [Linum perenne]